MEKYKNRLIVRVRSPRIRGAYETSPVSSSDSKRMGWKIYISPSPLGRCISRIAVASPLYFTPDFKSRSNRRRLQAIELSGRGDAAGVGGGLC